MFSAYMLDVEHGWTGVHRLPLKDAIHYCLQYQQHNFGALVAVVPDNDDPEPYLRLVRELVSRELASRVRNIPSNRDPNLT